MNLTLEVQAAVAGLQEYRIPEVGNDGRGVTCYVQPALVKVLIEALTIPDWYYADGAEHRVCRDWEAAGEGALAGRLSRVLADYGLLLVTKADGPGFVARITPNQLDAKTLVEVWDDGGFKLDGPPDRSPNMDKPALAAVMPGWGAVVWREIMTNRRYYLFAIALALAGMAIGATLTWMIIMLIEGATQGW